MIFYSAIGGPLRVNNLVLQEGISLFTEVKKINCFFELKEYLVEKTAAKLFSVVGFLRIVYGLFDG